MKATMFLKVWRRLISIRNDSRAVLIVITALLFPVLVAFMVLALDVGLIYNVKRNQQKAADSAVMGAGQEIWRQHADKVIPAGKADAKKNGFDDDDSAVTVTVEYPYSYNGANGNDYVRVMIEEVVPTYFARIFEQTEVTVRSQAVAGLVGYADGCYYVLNKEEKQAFKSVGGSILKADCGLLINSDNPAGFSQNGGGEVCVTSVGIVGGYNNAPTCTQTGGPYPTTRTGIPRVYDPLANFLTTPEPTNLTNYGNVQIGNNDDVDLWPGYYTQIKQTGGVSRLNEGLYYVDGNFTVNGGDMSSLSDGVTIYVVQQVTINGNAGNGGGNGGGNAPGVNLYAPVTGTYDSIPGILFWSPSDRTQKTAGNAQSVFNGTLYFPNALLTFRGTNDSSAWQMVVCDTGEHVGNSTSVNNFKGTFQGMPPVRKVTLLQ